MPIEWQMQVITPGQTQRTLLDPEGVYPFATGGVGDLTSFSVAGDGNCLEAEFYAQPLVTVDGSPHVTIRARDLVVLKVREDSADLWTSIYAGIVVLAGSPQATGLRKFRAVGVKRRFYEMLTEGATHLDGGDVGLMVREAMTTFDIPNSVTYLSAHVPETTFELGDRYPNLESLGELFDSLAETVGTFIVPTAGTYTYDGVTYSAGDTVPGVRWGVGGNETFFFKRPQESPVAVTEGASGVAVQWTHVEAEDIHDSVAFIYAGALAVRDADSFVINSVPTSPGGYGTPAVQTAYPLHSLHGSAVNSRSVRTVELSAPTDFMKKATLTLANRNGTWNGPGNAIDGNDTTAEQLTSSSGSVRYTAAGVKAGIWRVVYEVPTAGSVDMEIQWETAADITLGSMVFVLDEPQTRIGTAYIPMPIPSMLHHAEAAVAPLDKISIFPFSPTSGLKLYALECFIPDQDVGDRLAAAYYREAAEYTSLVEVYGSLGAVSHAIEITRPDASVVKAPVERVEYSLTKERGLVTRYHTGRAYPGDEEIERVLLQRLAKDAVGVSRVRGRE